mgnify:CR=1 FL=1
METMQESKRPACPYKGLQPYTEEDRGYFFGRDREIRILIANLYAAPLFGYEMNDTSTIVVAVAVIVLGGILNMLGIRRLAFLARLGVVVEVVGTLVG